MYRIIDFINNYTDNYYFKSSYVYKVFKKIIKERVTRLITEPFHRHWLVKLLGLLGIRSLLWRLYCRLLRPKNGILQLEIEGKLAKFFVQNEIITEKLLGLGGEGLLIKLMIQNLKTGDCFYDIGAEFGLYTLFLAQVVGEKGIIIAFEPENSRYEQLLKNLRINDLKNVRVFPLALGDSDGQGELLLDNIGTAPSLLGISPQRNSCQIVQKIKIVEGDRFVKINNLPFPRAVKIDVEGYEYFVIKGLQKTLSDKTCEIVCCEIHQNQSPSGITSDVIINLLRSYGFNRIECYPHRGRFHAFCYKN